MNLPGGSVHGDKERRNRPPSGAAGTGERQYRLQGMRQREAQRRKPLASMIALHTDDMWQSVRCYPNGPGNRSSRQGTGPSAEGPFSGGVLCPIAGYAGYSCDSAPLSLQRGNPQQLVLAVYYRRARRPASREKITASRPVKSKKIGKSDKHFGLLQGIDLPGCGGGMGTGTTTPPPASPSAGGSCLLWDEFWRSDALW